MVSASRPELHLQHAPALARDEMSGELTSIDGVPSVARLAPAGPERRAQRLASGALRRATESGIPTITTPMRSGSTEQMIEDMRAERV